MDGDDRQLLPAKVILGEGGDKEVNFLKQRLPRIGISVPETIETHIAGIAAYEERHTELLFRVSKSSWEDSLLKMVTAFEIQCCSAWAPGSPGTPILQINHPGFFTRDCIPAHLSVPLRSVSFGNLINAGQFLSHFTRHDDCEGPDALKWLCALRDEKIAHAMVADFEHDRSVMTVRFAVLDGGYKPKNNEKVNMDKRKYIPASAIALKMKYSSVRRIVVDLDIDCCMARIYFQLNFPVEIRKFRKKPFDPMMRDGDRHRSFPESAKDKRDNCVAINESPFICLECKSLVAESELYGILCRLHARIGLPLDFTRIHTKYIPVSKYVAPPVRMIRCDHHWSRTADGHADRNQSAHSVELSVDERCAAELKRRKNFGLEYFIAALISRGAIVKDQILNCKENRDSFISMVLAHYDKDKENCKENRDSFINMVLAHYDKDKEVTMEALERLLNMLDERREAPPLFRTFEDIRKGLIAESDQLKEIYAREETDGYRRVRKMVLTPTRMLLVVPELLMGNRVLRTYDESGDYALRVQFRDDDGSRMKQNTNCKENRDSFINMVLAHYDKDKEVTMEALERLLNMLDERREAPPLFRTFEDIRKGLIAESDQLKEIYAREETDGYRRVRKMVLTPTRMLLVVPELLMGNRVLRTYDESGDYALRVQFRDDDGSRMKQNTVGQYLINATVHDTMERGVYIADRHFVYLASSNSQMRDNGCYFFDDGDGGRAQQIRKDLGVFDRSNIPKLMARMGQCFTQAKQCSAKLRHKRYNKTFDLIGGRDTSGEPYIFSDGCGRMSQEFARKIANDLDIGKCVPSCFQDKFHAPLSNTIEIVKYSSPTPVCLNRPFIAILDQVSGMQGYQAHTRICERICLLLDRQLMQMAETLMSEDKCRDRLRELPRRVNVDELSLARGFALTQEPFFRSLLRASVAYTIKKQLTKAQIQIPPHLGRTLFGIVDETGILQYGQVFVQYTNAVENKTPGPSAAKTILKGRVLMTKNPQIVAGDARVFNAIDVPELRHLVDVVVFPQYGPRPHSDEMSGSDLDGDEYCVIWDEQLMLDYNEEASDFTKQSREPDDVSDDEVVPAMLKFFVDYIKQDSIGTIANAFMVNADLYGITSAVCLNIAQKQSQSVDFPKTGQPPEPLVKVWTENEDGSFLPPERAERWPDFMNKPYEPSYVSPRLLGHLFRRTRLVEDVLTITTAYEERDAVSLDIDLLYPRREEYYEDAKAEFNTYSADVRALLDNYGVQDEGQLFSGCISVLRNRISDRDMDDMSVYNTNHMIERKLNDIFLRFRENFFEEFGGYWENTDPEYGSSNNEGLQDDQRRICTNPSSAMKMKASAYYEICYTEASSNTSSKRLLSFPWVVWDVLACIKQNAKTRIISIDPLNECLSEAINRFCEKNSGVENFMQEITRHSSSAHAIRRYCRRYKGLDKLMFVAWKWAEQQELFEGRLNAQHLCLLFIQFGLGYLSAEDVSRPFSFLEKTDDLMDEHSPNVIDLNDRLGGLGKCFIKFLQFLSSRSFETIKMINFMRPNLGYHSVLMRGQWLDLHKAAVKSFYRIVLTGRFEELSYACDSSARRSHDAYLREIEPFVVELPEDRRGEDEQIRRKMQIHSGVKYLQLRRIANFRNRVVVSAVGTMESLHRLRNILAVKPSLNSYANNKSRSEMISRLVYERISLMAV
ncbi:putative RNA-dependent RNA polymerase SHL2 [Toxocara canis]|uniref:RNA-directed RNA polymerase n=1 Tax=Toxocara canis TaxID=6265 RepID=A0A0B2V9R3_TOXCA|nr:putative RNA-dependent RNA polymerase SHL2 [Toxocara canis]